VTAVAGPDGSLDPATPSPQLVDEGATTQFTFHADHQHYVGSVTGCGCSFVNSDKSVKSRTETTPPITTDCTVTATFVANNSKLTVDVSGKGDGTVVSSDKGISCPDGCEQIYITGQTVTLTAEPDGSSTFKGWSGDCAGTEPVCTLTMDGAKNATAVFHYFPWPLFLQAIENGLQEDARQK
jgi:uncharacterized repeat protein (TIGR02543 family)